MLNARKSLQDVSLEVYHHVIHLKDYFTGVSFYVSGCTNLVFMHKLVAITFFFVENI